MQFSAEKKEPSYKLKNVLLWFKEKLLFNDTFAYLWYFNTKIGGPN